MSTADAAPNFAPLRDELHQFFLSGETLSVEYRRQQLRAMLRMLTENEGAFAEALQVDLSKVRDPGGSWRQRGSGCPQSAGCDFS